MTYRDKLLFAASRLTAGPLTEEQRQNMSVQLSQYAVVIGHMEEVLDEMAEENRKSEQARWCPSSNVVPFPVPVRRLPALVAVQPEVWR